MSKPAPDLGAPSAALCVLVFLDPRRWFGALLALFGVLVSIIAPFLPTSLFKRITPPPPPQRTLHRPSPSPLQPSIITRRSRPRTADRPQAQPPSSPHVTFSFDLHPRSHSAGSLVPSSSQSSSDPSPPPKSVLLPDPSSPHPSPQASLLVLPGSPYSHPDPLPSIESLDLASTEPFQQQNTKRPFRISIPGFGKRADPKSQGEPAVPVTQLPRDTADEEGWHGTKAFAVKRSHTIATSPTGSEHPLPSPSPQPRRKFSLFSREGSSKEAPPPSPPASHTITVTPPDAINTAVPPVPKLPSPATLERMVASLPSAAAHLASAGPSTIPPPPSPSPAPVTLVQDMALLEQTTTPPPRPARTDPYKAYGVPVPGSERARAFLKAEKEWRKAEKERREREGRSSAVEVREREDEAAPAGEEHVEGARPCLKRASASLRSRGSVKKEKEKATVEDEAAEADVEDEKEAPMSEFGVLDAPPPLPRPRTESHAQGKRSWVFSRRSQDFTEEREKEKEREKKEKRSKSKEKDEKRTKDKDKDKDDKKRPKSRDGSKSKKRGFGSASAGKNGGKDRGYASDTGVPSLTYKLMP